VSLQVSKDHTHLLKDGKHFFWLADTCWSAFTNISDEEWDAYLTHRAEQGFNVLQINTLPQWDRCGTRLNWHPFPLPDGIHYDFSVILPEYFGHARQMCRKAVERGFTLALVVMWCNYVPDTWASNIFDGNIIPEACVEPIVRTICESFNEFEPVYLVSGDTGFDSEASIARYRLVTDLVDKYAPEALKAYHIKGRYDGLPQEFCERADLYLYQSGHNVSAQDGCHTLAQHFAKRSPRHPVINSEPCYEQMGYSHKLYGRFRRAETRRALWDSLLSGASAGITYGAHGVWNWQKPDMPKNPISGEGFLQAYPCERALSFPGASDYAFARRLFESRSITALQPCREILAQYSEQIPCALCGPLLLIYLPVNAPLTLKGDWSDRQASVIDLSSGDSATLPLRTENGVTTLEMHRFYHDALILIEKRA